MSDVIPVTAGYLRHVIEKEIGRSIGLRRASQRVSGYNLNAPDAHAAVTEEEIDDFIASNPLFDVELSEQLMDPGLLGHDEKHATASPMWLADFRRNVSDWASNETWLAGEDLALLATVADRPELLEVYEEANPARGSVGALIRSPSLILVTQQMLSNNVPLHSIDHRDFEKLIAELLERDGWDVELTPQSRDGGIDVLAQRHSPGIGHVLTAWQAKKLDPSGNKVGLASIRELVTSVSDVGATKGVIVTSGKLSRDALKYVEQKKFLLSAAQHQDVLAWIKGTKRLSL